MSQRQSNGLVTFSPPTTKRGLTLCSFNGANGEEGTTMVKSFDKKEDAKKCAQGYNAVLTRDEKRFFEIRIVSAG